MHVLTPDHRDSSYLQSNEHNLYFFDFRKKTKSKKLFFELTFFPSRINTFWHLIIAIQAICNRLRYTCFLGYRVPGTRGTGGPPFSVFPKVGNFLFALTFFPGVINALWDLIIAIQAIPNRMSTTRIFRFSKKKTKSKKLFFKLTFFFRQNGGKKLETSSCEQRWQ